MAVGSRLSRLTAFLLALIVASLIAPVLQYTVLVGPPHSLPSSGLPLPSSSLNFSSSSSSSSSSPPNAVKSDVVVPDVSEREGNSVFRGCRLPYIQTTPHKTTLGRDTAEYLRERVSFAVITGSADGFFRADLALCTWLAHVPDSSLFFFTDRANTSDGRRGHWVSDSLPEGVTFTKQQVESKGYTLPWIKAQFRFLFGVKHIIEEDRARGTNKQWFLLVDDDTFVNLDGLVVKLKEYDVHGSGGAGRYLSDKGWGGAGHFFDRRASETLLKKMRSHCIDPYMVRSFHASDETLVKCAPQMGLKTSTEKTMSHCHANKLREAMLTGRHVSMHVKRDVAKPRYLAAWRTRLYYQVCGEKIKNNCGYTTEAITLLQQFIRK